MSNICTAAEQLIGANFVPAVLDTKIYDEVLPDTGERYCSTPMFG